jgi:hypothetical protein
MATNLKYYQHEWLQINKRMATNQKINTLMATNLFTNSDELFVAIRPEPEQVRFRAPRTVLCPEPERSTVRDPVPSFALVRGSGSGRLSFVAIRVFSRI